MEEHYIGVVYANLLGEFGDTVYNYKTKLPLKEGQILKVPTFNRKRGIEELKEVRVVRANVDPKTINFPLESIKEI